MIVSSGCGRWRMEMAGKDRRIIVDRLHNQIISDLTVSPYDNLTNAEAIEEFWVIIDYLRDKAKNHN